MLAFTCYISILRVSALVSTLLFYVCEILVYFHGKISVITKESCNRLGGLGHVHLKDKVGVSAEAQQAALLRAQLHKLIQDSRVLLSGESLK